MEGHDCGIIGGLVWNFSFYTLSGCQGGWFMFF